MLAYKLEGDILEVKEALMSFTSTKVSYWYYDIKNWRKSSHGKANDPCDRVMSASDIAWVEKYYIPKVLNTAQA